jgi:hypothetical protein
MTRSEKSRKGEEDVMDYPYVVTAWAERPKGPGWANALVLVLFRDRDGTLRVEAVQPGEQTPAMLYEFDHSELSARRLTSAARLYYETKTKPARARRRK